MSYSGAKGTVTPDNQLKRPVLPGRSLQPERQAPAIRLRGARVVSG